MAPFGGPNEGAGGAANGAGGDDMSLPLLLLDLIELQLAAEAGFKNSNGKAAVDSDDDDLPIGSPLELLLMCFFRFLNAYERVRCVFCGVLLRFTCVGDSRSYCTAPLFCCPRHPRRVASRRVTQQLHCQRQRAAAAGALQSN